MEVILIVHGGHHLDTMLTLLKMRDSVMLQYREFVISMTGVMIIIAGKVNVMSKVVMMMTIADGKINLVNPHIVQKIFRLNIVTVM